MKRLFKGLLIGLSLCTVARLLHAETVVDEKLLYDPVSGQMLTQKQIEARNVQELVLEASIDQVRLGELSVQKKGDILWVDFEELLTLLDFPIEVTQRGTDISAKGWFIRTENTFELQRCDSKDCDFEIKTPQQKTTSYKVFNDQLDLQPNQVKVELIEALNWFGITATPQISNLSLKLQSTQKLPIQERLLRQMRLSDGGLQNLEVQFPRQDVPYQAFSPIFTDIQFSANKDYSEMHRLNMSLLGTGDLAYMTGRYFANLSYDERTQKTTPNMRLTLERNSIESNLLGALEASHVSIVDISSTSIANLNSGGKDFGVRASNNPLGRVTNASSTTLSGLQQPGWEIELYLNDIYLDRQVVGDDGRYQFANQSLSVGENIFTFKFYGPQGQREERTETYVLDQSSLVGGKLIYDLSVSRQDWQLSDFFESEYQNNPTNMRLNAHVEKGLGQNFSLTGDYSQYHFSDNSLHQFVQPGFRLFVGETLVNAAWLKDLNAGSQANFKVARGFGVSRAHKLSYDFAQNTSDFAINFDALETYQNTHQVILQGPFHPTKNLKISYQLSAALRETFENTQIQSYAMNLGTQVKGINITNNLTYNETSAVNAGSTSRAEGNLQLSGRLGRVFVRTGAQYSVAPETQVNKSNIDFTFGLGQGWGAEINYGYDFIEEKLAQGYALNWQNNDFIARLKVGKSDDKYSANFILRFAFGAEPLTNRLMVSSSSLANTGGVSTLVYEDLNNNQRYDQGEPVLENVDVVAVQQNRRAKTDEVGVATISGLYGTQPTDVAVVAKSLPDPFFIPSVEGVSFLPRPGVIKTVYIPIVTAGEVEGTVRFTDGLTNNPVGQGQVPMLLTQVKNSKNIYQTKTAYDGFYLFDKVAPGSYLLQVDPSFITRKNIQARAPIPIEINHRGTLIMGANFELFSQEMFAYDEKPSGEVNAYDVNLGTFSSEQNARKVLKALRMTFPRLLGNIRGLKPLEMQLEQTPDQKVSLWLGTFEKLDHVKYLCASLVQQDLVCQVRKREAVVTPKLPSVAAATVFEKPALTILEKGFTLQLSSLESRMALEDFAELKQLKDTWIETAQVKGKTVYRLNLGRFKDRADAEKMAQHLKKTKGLDYWIKPL